MRRVVITGLGMVSPLAYGVEESWSRLLAGKSGIRELKGDFIGVDIADLPVRFGGQLLEDPTSEVPERPDRKYAGDISKQHVSKRRMSYVEQAAHVITKRLWDNAGRPDVDHNRLAAVVSMLQTSFCAVPALSRVDPVTTSGPVSRTMWAAAAADPVTQPDHSAPHPSPAFPAPGHPMERPAGTSSSHYPESP